VATDWGERFAALLDEHIKLPKKGNVLYVGSGTGGHAVLLEEGAGADVSFTSADESEERLAVAQAKSNVLKLPTKFRCVLYEDISFDDSQFDLVLCDASMIDSGRLRQTVAELVRVTAQGGTVAFTLPTAGSFGEFFSIYWEALFDSNIENHGQFVESLIAELPTVSDVEEMASDAGLSRIESWTAAEEFSYPSASDFFSSPLISDFLLTGWLAALADSNARDLVTKEIKRIMDADRHEIDFTLSLKATLVKGHKFR
jgi:ubiquinone/menaquinone biosynthesis C-methylase UbiE